MKNFITICFSITLILTSCSKSDPCEGIVCKNGGTCVDGKCQCPNGFEGTLCESESLPSGVVVTGLKALKVPATKSDGSKWDADGTNPDIFPALYTLKSDNTPDQALWASDVTKLNAPPGQIHDFIIVLPKLTMKTFDRSIAFYLFDKDDPNSEVMGGISFMLKDVVKGKPSTITLDCATCKVAFELKVTYE